MIDTFHGFDYSKRRRNVIKFLQYFLDTDKTVISRNQHQK